MRPPLATRSVDQVASTSMVGRPVGVIEITGAWLLTLPPQHCIKPSVRTAQVWSNPALTWLNAPTGGLVCPLELLPQQVSESLLWIAQTWA